MTSTETDAFLDTIKAFEGRVNGPPARALDAVNEPMIRHWCDAMADDNPIYVDAAAAEAAGHDGIVAPPTMLQAWSMRGLRGRQGQVATEQDSLLAILDDAGFTSVVATNCEQDYGRYLRPGDRVTVTTTIESVSPEKNTALGRGHFVTTLQEYRDEAGEIVGTMRFRILKFAPAAKPAASDEKPRPKRPRPAITHDNAFFFEGTKAGKLLIQRCSSCQQLRHPARTRCARSAIRSSGTRSRRAAVGTVFSFVVNHHPKVPAFDYPARRRRHRTGRRHASRVEPHRHRSGRRRDRHGCCRRDGRIRRRADAPAVSARHGRRSGLMDFSFNEEQNTVRELSAQIFDGMAGVDRVKEVEASEHRLDHALWLELAKANLLGLAVPEDHGGSGLGMIELCLVLQEQGRRVAPIPLLAGLVLGTLPLTEFGTERQKLDWVPGILTGHAVVTAALEEPGSLDPSIPRTKARANAVGEGWTLHGTKVAVLAGHIANRILVPAAMDDGSVNVFLVDPLAGGVERQIVETTDRQRQAHFVFAGVDVGPADIVGPIGTGAAIVRWIIDRALVGLCAIQLGVAEEALRMAAEYTSGRLQFGKPLSTFQGVSLRAADAYIDISAMRVTLWQAAWRLDHGPRRRRGDRHRQVVGGRRRRAGRARHPASARWHRRRRRLPRAPLLPVGQADRRHAGRSQQPTGPPRCGDRHLLPVARHMTAVTSVAVGDELPPLDIPLTRTLIVATAIASRDYQDVHHDSELARQRGSKDIFMNILTTNGFVGRFVTDWAGPTATLKRVAIRLGAPNYPGDTMRMTGTVTAVTDEGADRIIDVEVRGANSLGDHVSGTVRLVFPAN